MKQRLSDALPLILAFLVPLAGVVLTLNELARGRQGAAARIGLATVFGVALYAALFL